MAAIEFALTIDRSPDDVFIFVTDPANDHLWWESVIHTENLTGGDLRAGSQLRQHCKVMGVFDLYNQIHVAEYHPPYSILYQTESNLLPYSALYRLTPVDSGRATQFRIEATVTPKGALKRMAPLLLWTVKNDLKRYFAVLKKHLESVNQPAAAGR